MSNVRSIERVLDLLEHFASSTDAFTLTSIASHFDLPKSSTLAILRTVVDRGYVVKNEQGHYLLEENFRRHGFGWGGDRFSRVLAFTKPVMQAMCDEIGETVMVGALVADDTVRMVAQVVTTQIVRYEQDPNAISPAYCTAMGRTLLAFSDERVQERVLSRQSFVRHTAKTVVDPVALRRIVTKVHKERLAVVDSEYIDGGVGIAVPIFGDNGNPLLALNVGCVSTRYAEKKERIVASLRNAAQYIQTNYPQSS